MNKLLVLITFVIISIKGFTQELRARVSVISNRVSTNVDKKVFLTLQTALNDFINNRKWTTDNFTTAEKIDCSFLFNLEEGGDANVYKASLTIQSGRPVFNSSYQSPIMNFQDDEIIFRYLEYQQLEYNENRITGTDALASNLTAVIAYYINIILGLDYDSFGQRGGDVYFKKAQNIINNSPDGRGITGWKSFDGVRNRYWLAENLLNSKYTIMHDVYYNYYRLGLDAMYDDEASARDEVLNVLNTLNTYNIENPNTMILQFFFQGKDDEMIKIFSKASPADRLKASEFLQKMDISNSAKYKAALK